MIATLDHSDIALFEGPTAKVRARAVGAYRAALRSLRPSVVHLHNLNTDAAHLLVNRFLGVPPYVGVRTIHSTQLRLTPLTRLALRFNPVSGTIFCSSAVRNQNEGLVGGSHVTIANGLAFEAAPRDAGSSRSAKLELGLDPEMCHFVCVGRFSGATPDRAPKAHDTLIQAKTAYLNVPFFLGRAALYFVVWTGLAYALDRLSRQQDHDADPAIAKRMSAISAGGLVAFALTLTFAIFDWLMSLDPHWFSSIYGVYYFGGAVLTALSLLVVLMLWMRRFEPMNDVLRPTHFHDWGKLMLAFTMLWAYFSVSQLIITWSGNLPEEVPWYMARTSGMWKIFPYLIIILHFFVPFALLLSSDLKSDSRRLAGVAVFILVMRFVDTYWQAAPSMNIEQWHWLDIVLPVAIGGLWLGTFFTLLADRPILPRNDPFFDEAVDHHG